jgi:hypothetical protein
LLRDFWIPRPRSAPVVGLQRCIEQRAAVDGLYCLEQGNISLFFLLNILQVQEFEDFNYCIESKIAGISFVLT